MDSTCIGYLKVILGRKMIMSKSHKFLIQFLSKNFFYFCHEIVVNGRRLIIFTGAVCQSSCNRVMT